MIKSFVNLLLIFLLISNTFIGFSQKAVNLKHISPTIEGLNAGIRGTVQDQDGNIWMLYNGAILIFNGYEYKHITNEEILNIEETDDKINFLSSDHHYNIWALYRSGQLVKYNPNSDHHLNITSEYEIGPISAIVHKEDGTYFISKKGIIYKYAKNSMEPLADLSNSIVEKESIYGIEINHDGIVFLSTTAGNIYTYDILGQKLALLETYVSGYPTYLNFIIDRQNKLWIGTENLGLFIYDINQKVFIQDTFLNNDKYNFSKEIFIKLYLDSQDNMWCGSDGGGLFKIHSVSGATELYYHEHNNDFSLSNNTILDIYEDRNYNIWITTKYGNLNIFPHNNKNIGFGSGSTNFYSQPVLSMLQSNDGTLWIGTDGAGLIKSETTKDGQVRRKHYFKSSQPLDDFYIQSMSEDNQSNIWIGTYRNGLWHYNGKTEKLTKISNKSNSGIQVKDVRTVYTDSKNRIWISSNAGLTVYSAQQKILADFPYNKNNLKGSIAESIIEDSNGRMWLGMIDGGLYSILLNEVDLQVSKFLHHPPDSSTSISSIRVIKPTSSDELWLVNGLGKIIKYNIPENKFQTISFSPSHTERVFLGLEIQDDDNIWASSKNGIVHYNIKTNVSEVFYKSDGLQDNLFLSRSSYKDKSGNLYFGGVQGYNFFNPSELTKEQTPANLNITEINILNQPAEKQVADQITAGINNISTLNLKHKQSSFSIEFAAVGDILNPDFHYAYRLKNFDDEWISTKTQRTATYTNIPSGHYTFEVKAGNIDQLYNIDRKSLDINISASPLKSNTAIIIYCCLLGLIGAGIRRWYILREKLFLEKITHKKENELHVAKLDFFTKMSHEIQTPITIILGPIQDMIEKAKINGDLLLKQRLNIIENNANRLSRIAKKLTLLRDKDMDRLQLFVTKNDLSNNVLEVTTSFKELARQKRIDYEIYCPKDLQSAWYDKEKFTHVLYNLISNAFKFTPKEGEITVQVDQFNEGKSIRVKVIDSGPGIPKEEFDNIFKMFYQTNHNKRRVGAGIGLALVKEIIDLHKGKISVKSKRQKGTTFIVELNTSENAYDASEKIVTDNSEIEDINLSSEIKALKSVSPKGPIEKTILIVEDNLDLIQFMSDLLQPYYNVITAEDGEEGYYYAKSNMPDLILSDIMMPKKNGIELCENLQADVSTKHIPIILITAKNSTNSKISGLKSGAIEYINKPFNTRELLLKINNILSSKDKTIKQYKQEKLSQPIIENSKSKDEVFLEELVRAINAKIDKSSLKMEEIAEDLNISYSTLYRNCQALTGHSIVDYVRIIRLKKAALLLTKYGYSISQTAYKSGFNDPKYFSKCFKKQFKKSPLEFKRESKKEGYEQYLKSFQLSLD